MDREEFQFRCYELCKQAGNKLPDIIMEKALAFAWEVSAYGHTPEATKESLSESVGDMYISLMAAAYAFGLDSGEVGDFIKQQLGM